MRLYRVLPALSLILSATLLASCVEFGAEPDSTEDLGTRSASFTAGGKAYTFEKPYIGIFDNNGKIFNWITLKADDKSQLDLKWDGTSTGTIKLEGFSSASWKSPTGEQYNPTSGELVITSYKADPNSVSYVASGTFHFTGESIDNPGKTIEITGGVLTNAANRVD